MPSAAILLMSIEAGCGDNRDADDSQPACAVTAWNRDQLCYAAQIFAQRDAEHLVPQQDELDRYFERWARAAEAEPILDGRIPQMYRLGGNPPTSLIVYTTAPHAIAAWEQGMVWTGDPAIDDVLAPLNPMRILWNPHDPTVFELELDGDIYSEEVLANELAVESIAMKDPMPLPQDDGSWMWLVDDTAQIDFTFGWGDCFVGCAGFHSVRALVPETGDAMVYDLGGDPLPPYLMLAPGTHPLP